MSEENENVVAFKTKRRIEHEQTVARFAQMVEDAAVECNAEFLSIVVGFIGGDPNVPTGHACFHTFTMGLEDRPKDELEFITSEMKAEIDDAFSTIPTREEPAP